MPNNDEKFIEKNISSKDIYQGNFLKYQVDEVVLPNGDKSVRDVVRHPGAVAILPILPDGRILFVRQYRYAIDKIIYELTAGKIDKGEEPLSCAKRELKEETGYSANNWLKMGSIFTVPGFCDEIIHVYKAEDLTPGEQQPDEDEVIELVAFTETEAAEMVKAGIICDSKTLAGLYLYGLMK